MALPVRLALCLLLAISMAGAQQAPDPCEVNPDLPDCEPPPPAPGPVPAPVEGFPWTQVATYSLGAVVALLLILKTTGVLDVALRVWEEGRADRARHGHPHGDHHRKRRPRKPQDPPSRFA